MKLTEEDIDYYNQQKAKQIQYYKPKKEKKIKEAKAKIIRINISPDLKRYQLYVRRANKKGLSFLLNEEQFKSILSGKCVYCNGKAECIDRRDNNKGYEEDNIQPCCNKCNIMKYTFKEEEFIEHIMKVLLYYTPSMAYKIRE